MKIDRRAFLSIGSFIIGGAAGTALSPLPAKITDDLSIWSQNWPWTPVPPDGEASYVNSACTLCPGGCGITVRKIDDRAVKIEGTEGHPVNDGGICILGLSGLQLLYGPTRVKTPLKREKRGQGKWIEISWDEAISEVAKKLGELRKKGESHTVACMTGPRRGTVSQLFNRFLTAYGSPNFMPASSVQDSYEITLKLMNGVQALAGFDVDNADYVLSFGSGILDGWGSPVRMFGANSALNDKKGKMVQIEPRLSNTAAKADKWLPIVPGTEAVLALGMAHVIIKESLYNKEFIQNHTSEFEGFKKLVLSKYLVGNVANETGLNKADIEETARNFAKASKPLAICGRGQGKTPGSIQEFMAVHALNALVGNINKQGGVWAVAESECNWPDPKKDAVAEKGLKAARADGADKYPCSKCLLNRFPAAADSGKVKALLVSGSNPCYTLPDTKAVKKAFDKIPFVVSFSSYMDETAQNADMILPNHIYLERYEDVSTPFSVQKPVTGISRPVVDPLFNTKHTGDVIISIAKALKGTVANSFPWDSYEACLKETMGDKWEKLESDGFVCDSKYKAPAWGESFKTGSGKFEFFTKECKQPGIEGNKQAYPLVLIPYDSMRLANGYIGDPPFLIKTVEDTVLKGQDIFVEINPATANAFGLRDGKYATLSTPKGKAKVRVHFFDGIRPGVVAMPRGLGHTAYDKYLAGKGINFNDLIGPVEDPGSGLDAAWGIRAKLT
ncbi:MAG: molybdopterin-dependent oxidoreductase [Desulfobacterales bacterium]|nr:molybdopterin-dependent oxidoreductase [Desulfobacterales bacterium]